MKRIKDEILRGLTSTQRGGCRAIEVLDNLGYPSWTVKTDIGECGVALPYEGDEINEAFAGFEMRIQYLAINGDSKRALLLVAGDANQLGLFASICEDFLDPGESGKKRQERQENPRLFWASLKELVGNRNIDEAVYCTIAELHTLRLLSLSGLKVGWNGPEGASYDIEGDDALYEVKSSTNKSVREITVSSVRQLKSPDSRPLYLFFCEMEKQNVGLTINKEVEALVSIGFSEDELNAKLERLNLAKGRAARDRGYVLHAIRLYSVDENFPAITENSFKDGHIPSSIGSITYSVILDGVEELSMEYLGIADIRLAE